MDNVNSGRDTCPICGYSRPNGGIDREVICSEACRAKAEASSQAQASGGSDQGRSTSKRKLPKLVEKPTKPQPQPQSDLTESSPDRSQRDESLTLEPVNLEQSPSTDALESPPQTQEEPEVLARVATAQVVTLNPSSSTDLQSQSAETSIGDDSAGCIALIVVVVIIYVLFKAFI